MEAVRPSQAVGDQFITLSIDPFGDGKNWVQIDQIRLTVLSEKSDSSTVGMVDTQNGSVSMTATDLLTDGYAGPWSLSRAFSDSMEPTGGDIFGNGWSLSVPYLVNAGGTVAIYQGGSAMYFDQTASGYVARDGIKSVLVANGSCSYLYNEDGSEWTFYDDEYAGNFKEDATTFTNPYGEVVASISYNSNDEPSKIVHGSDTYVLTYCGSGADAGLVEDVLLERQDTGDTALQVVGEAKYAYYGSNDPAGNNSRDLESVTIYNGSSNAPANETDVTYYRYYSHATSSGYAPTSGYDSISHLRAVVSNAAYERMPSDPTTSLTRR